MSAEKKANLSEVSKFSITLTSGIIAGFAAAILSHVGATE
jgi:solute carrier family 25 phosphate transporter 3